MITTDRLHARSVASCDETKRIDSLTVDRDEWRTQHENLLVMYRAAEDRCHAYRATIAELTEVLRCERIRTAELTSELELVTKSALGIVQEPTCKRCDGTGIRTEVEVDCPCECKRV